MLGAFGAFLLAARFVVRYRARLAPGDDPSTLLTPGAPANPRLELAVIVGILGLFVGFWLIGYVQYVRVEVPPPDGMRVYVTGKQWMWKFAHADGKSSMDVLT